MEHGRAAQRGELPWHVSVGLRQNRGPDFSAFDGHRGGGTIVGTRWVLTAAHCLAPVSDALTRNGQLTLTRDIRLRVTFGTDLTAPEREVDVTFVQVHPQFDPRSLEYDAALLLLSDDVDGAIRLEDRHLSPGDCGIVAGWSARSGSTERVRKLSCARMQVGDRGQMPPLDAELVCNPGVMFVAGGTAAGPDFRSARVGKGDSGGGFVVTRASTPALAGIVSWSGPSAEDGTVPCVFTRTLPLADWIRRTMDCAP